MPPVQSRKSRKLREATYMDGQQQNLVLQELTTPKQDGTIPLLNFIENTTNFVKENVELKHKMKQLEEKFQEAIQERDSMKEAIKNHLEQFQISVKKGLEELGIKGMEMREVTNLFIEGIPLNIDPENVSSTPTFQDPPEVFQIPSKTKNPYPLQNLTLLQPPSPRPVANPFVFKPSKEGSLEENRKNNSKLNKPKGRILRNIYENNILLNKKLQEEMEELEKLRKIILEE